MLAKCLTVNGQGSYRTFSYLRHNFRDQYLFATCSRSNLNPMYALSDDPIHTTTQITVSAENVNHS